MCGYKGHYTSYFTINKQFTVTLLEIRRGGGFTAACSPDNNVLHGALLCFIVIQNSPEFLPHKSICILPSSHQSPIFLNTPPINYFSKLHKTRDGSKKETHLCILNHLLARHLRQMSEVHGNKHPASLQARLHLMRRDQKPVAGYYPAAVEIEHNRGICIDAACYVSVYVGFDVKPVYGFVDDGAFGFLHVLCHF